MKLYVNVYLSLKLNKCHPLNNYTKTYIFILDVIHRHSLYSLYTQLAIIYEYENSRYTQYILDLIEHNINHLIMG
ncbi:unnamed protein product [Acanthoscelides obtectus]|uniref:Uncharacterized protein n=1 Tax=Acanthoscelides obtectus TaxID=200917 RepID=A0A9P0ME94_ACAOB|nr:unnamed protein product [Acanthoscelides obtectus]CAK1659569.1 hypothetical protein AOBTE_LOCUS21545 [Acanthoscelides obtectus]